MDHNTGHMAEQSNTIQLRARTNPTMQLVDLRELILRTVKECEFGVVRDTRPNPHILVLNHRLAKGFRQTK